MSDQSDNAADPALPEDRYTSAFQAGQHNVQAMGLDFHNPVFVVSAVTVVLFVVFTLSFPGLAAEWFGQLRPWLTTRFDWYFMLIANLLVLLCVVLGVLPMGRIRIGGTDARPVYSYLSWVSMLFAAGIGIGIMFYAVLEPMNHVLTAPLGLDPATELDQRRLAMAATIYHWAIHPWAIYAIVGLSLAFFSYNKGMPPIMRSVMYPLPALTSMIGIALVLIFFVTSMDSGALIVDTMTAGGKIDTPLTQRVFWCCFIGLIGIALLFGGGLASTQALALANGFPFAGVILLMGVSLYRGLAREVHLLDKGVIDGTGYPQADAEY